MHQQKAMTARILGLLVAERSCALGNGRRRSDFSTLETPLAKPTSSQLVNSGRPHQRVFSASWELMTGTFVSAGAGGEATRRPHPPTWGAGRLETSWLVLFRAFGLGATQEGTTAIQRVASTGTLAKRCTIGPHLHLDRTVLVYFDSWPLCKFHAVARALSSRRGPAAGLRQVAGPLC